MPVIDEEKLKAQFRSMTLEQLKALQVQLEANNPSEGDYPRLRGLTPNQAGLMGAGEGALLGLQGRPLSELSILKRGEGGENLGLFRQKELIKSQIEEEKTKRLLETEEGGFKPTGFTSGGVKFEKEQTEEERQIELAQEMERKRGLKLAEAEASMQPAKNILTKLQEEWFKAFPDAPEEGVGRFQYGIGKSIEAVAQTDENVASYLATRKAFLSLLVRGLGEKGVLTNIDIERIEQAIPSQWTVKKVARKNFETIEDILTSAAESFVNKGGDINEVNEVLSSASIQATQQGTDKLQNLKSKYGLE